MERMTGVEPAFKAWEAFVLPMNYIRKVVPFGHDLQFSTQRMRMRTQTDMRYQFSAISRMTQPRGRCE